MKLKNKFMPIPRRDDDPVHVLPEEEEVITTPPAPRVAHKPAAVSALASMTATAATGLFTDEREGPDYGRAGE